MSARAHAAAVKALLTPVAGLVVYDGVVPSVEFRAPLYVALYVTLPLPANYRLSGSASQQRVTVTTLYLGNNPEDCREVADRTRAALVRRRPIIAGRNTSPLTLSVAGNPHEDDDQLPAAWVATDIWSFASTGPRI